MIFFSVSYAQNVGIGTIAPHPSARLEVWDTVRGVLIPRLTLSQRQAIPNPAHGLLIYNTTCQQFEFYDGVLQKWVPLLRLTKRSSSLLDVQVYSPSPGEIVIDWSHHALPGNPVFWLEISTDTSFSASSLVPGYNPRWMGQVTRELVDSLQCLTTYYIRVRAYSPCTDTVYSAVRSVRTQGFECKWTHTWTPTGITPPLPVREDHVATAWEDQKIFVGFGGAGSTCYNDWWEWDVCTGLWIQRTPFPGPNRPGVFAVSVDSFIYVGGGKTCAGSITLQMWRYDPYQDQWTQLPDLPASVFGHHSATSDGQRYIFVVTTTGDIWQYDIHTQQWSQIAVCPSNCGVGNYRFIVFKDSILYTGGGKLGNICNTEFWAFDLSTQQWIQLPDLPAMFTVAYAIPHRSQLIVGVREFNCGPCVPLAYIYDIPAQTWQPGPRWPQPNADDYLIGGWVRGILFGGIGDNHCAAVGALGRFWYGWCPP